MNNKGVVIGAIVGLGLVVTTVVLTTRPAIAIPGTAIVLGLVIDDLGAPISGVKVTLGGLSTLTNSIGIYTFSNVAEGTYSMSFSKSGYETVYL